MARHRTLVRLARSLRAIVLGAIAAGLATALFEWDLGRDLVLPLGVLALAPPVAYVGLALLVLRAAPGARRLRWALAACGVNAAIGLATAVTLSLSHPLSFEGAFLRAFGGFVPAPLIHLAAAPMVLLAFRPRVKRPRAARRARAAAPLELGPPLAVETPNYDDVLRPSTLPEWVTAPGQAVFERARPAGEDEPHEPRTEAAVIPIADASLVVSAARAVDGTTAAPRESGVVLAAVAMPVSAVPEDPMLRVAFERLIAQLPPDVFVLPPRRLGESLREPHTLLVPRRLVVPQLGEGAIEIPWTLVEDQFPDLALAIPRAEIRKRFPDWVLLLPLDDVIGQIPADLFRVVGPAADLSDIDRFPAPFTPGPPAPVVDLEEPAPDRTTPVSVADRAASSELSVGVPRPAQERHAVADPAPPLRAVSTQVGAAMPTSAPRPAERPVEPRDDSLVVLVRALAVTLAPVGALESGSRRLGGRPLICFVAPVLRREAIDALATRAFALLERLGPSSIDQITVRTSRVACVVGMLAAGGAVATAVRRGGPVALLEILTARARGAGRGVPSPGAPAAVPVSPVVDGNGRVGEAVRALSVFGPLLPTEVTAGPDVPGVYVFAARADAGLAGAAREVHEALVRDHDESALGRLESVALRRGRERVIVRPLRGVAETPALLAAAGEISLPGRAQRAAARAAALLEAR